VPAGRHLVNSPARAAPGRENSRVRGVRGFLWRTRRRMYTYACGERRNDPRSKDIERYHRFHGQFYRFFKSNYLLLRKDRPLCSLGLRYGSARPMLQ